MHCSKFPQAAAEALKLKIFQLIREEKQTTLHDSFLPRDSPLPVSFLPLTPAPLHQHIALYSPTGKGNLKGWIFKQLVFTISNTSVSRLYSLPLAFFSFIQSRLSGECNAPMSGTLGEAESPWFLKNTFYFLVVSWHLWFWTDALGALDRIVTVISEQCGKQLSPIILLSYV